MLDTSIFFFSHNVFKRLFPPVRQKSSLCGKGLTRSTFLAKSCFEGITVSAGKELIDTDSQILKLKLTLSQPNEGSITVSSYI